MSTTLLTSTDNEEKTTSTTSELSTIRLRQTTTQRDATSILETTKSVRNLAMIRYQALLPL